MIAPAWLAQLLGVDGEIEDVELAGRLAQRLRLQVPTGPEGVGVLTRFALLAETLYKRPDDLVEESLPNAPGEAEAAAAQLGLRTKSDLERVMRLAARELWAYLAANPPAPVAEGKRPSSPGNRAPEDAAAEERLAAFAAQAIAEARGEAPAAAPPPVAPAPAAADDSLEEFAARAMAEARERAARGEVAATPPPTAVARPEPVAPPVPVTPAVPPPADHPEPRTFGEQLEAAGPLIVFLATVGAGTIFLVIIWLVGTATGVFGGN